MDSDLKFHSHSCNDMNKASQCYYTIKKNVIFLDSHTHADLVIASFVVQEFGVAAP